MYRRSKSRKISMVEGKPIIFITDVARLLDVFILDPYVAKCCLGWVNYLDLLKVETYQQTRIASLPLDFLPTWPKLEKKSNPRNCYIARGKPYVNQEFGRNIF